MSKDILLIYPQSGVKIKAFYDSLIKSLESHVISDEFKINTDLTGFKNLLGLESLQIQHFSSLRDLLLPMLMNGQLKVSEL